MHLRYQKILAIFKLEHKIYFPLLVCYKYSVLFVFQEEGKCEDRRASGLDQLYILQAKWHIEPELIPGFCSGRGGFVNQTGH